MSSNLKVRSNLMIDDSDHRPEHRYLPGDYVREIYPGLTDSRVIDRELSKLQIVELHQYLRCTRCRKACAGTCGR